MTVQIYPQNPTARFIDSVVPQGSVAPMANPIVQKLIQLAQLPFSGCTPQNAGIKLRESFAHINPNSLLQHIAQAERWVIEHVISYISGEMPVWLRAPAWAIKALLIIQYALQLVANLLYLASILAHEVALMDAFIGESLLFASHIASTITSGGLRTRWETDLVQTIATAQAAANQAANEKHANQACLI
jgi:hypothetical protein